MPTCVACAGVNGAHKERQEWLSKGSSRLWRGSMRNSSWRHIGKGAWEPRCGVNGAHGKDGKGGGGVVHASGLRCLHDPVWALGVCQGLGLHAPAVVVPACIPYI